MNVRSEVVEVHGEDGRRSAYMALPEPANGVAIVVLQEIFGVNANIRAITDGFAADGFAAIAPDLYWRQDAGVELDPGDAECRERAVELMKGLDREQAVADASAALDTLRSRVRGIGRSAAVGYCFGGGVAFLMAARGLVDAGISYYGTGLHDMLAELDRPRGRLLLHLAADDHLCPPDAQAAIAAAAGRNPAEVSLSIHDRVGHAFARISGANYDRDAAERANAATASLLSSLAAVK